MRIDSSELSLIPPPNFGAVDRGIYRSGFPDAENLLFLDSLNLRSIVYLCPENYPEAISDFFESREIRIFQLPIEGSKEQAGDIPRDTIMDAMKVLLDIRNHPVLVHCNGGKHRTGSLIGCFRKLQNWRLSAICEEYVRYAGAKARTSDLKFIESFDVSRMSECVLGIIYRYHGCGSQAPRLVYHESGSSMPVRPRV